jgi:hypothetical protein
VSVIINNIVFIQHRIFVIENLNTIRCLTSINNIYKDSAQIARTINLLGNKLKAYFRIENELFHLYLYKSNYILYEREPGEDLLDNSDNIVVEYEKFRRKYSTRKKICNAIDGFKSDAQRIIRLLEKEFRIKKTVNISCC